MTLILDTKSKKPATHVVLIGVGAYPFLKGGAEKKKLFAHHENMGQLDSPPNSARAMADWFLSAFTNPSHPLGSLDILVSGGPAAYQVPGKQKKLNLHMASLDGVEKAVKAWADRCDRNPDNLAVFYFCGHGVVTGQEQSLLLQDFGKDPGNPFRDAMAFSQFRTGMRGRKVRNQCFFVDACRSVSETYLLTYGFNFAGTPVIAGGLTGSLFNKQSQVFFASALGTAAYGRKKRPSVFTEGLLSALNGMGGWQDDLGWAVATNRLADAINAYATEQMLLEKMPEQLCDTEGVGKAIPLHRMAREPQVPVLVACEPSEATSHANFSCMREGKQVAKGRCNKLPAWRTTLPPDRYDFHASFSAVPKQFVDGLSPARLVIPPLTPVRIKAAKV